MDDVLFDLFCRQLLLFFLFRQFAEQRHFKVLRAGLPEDPDRQRADGIGYVVLPLPLMQIIFDLVLQHIEAVPSVLQEKYDYSCPGVAVAFPEDVKKPIS